MNKEKYLDKVFGIQRHYYSKYKLRPLSLRLIASFFTTEFGFDYFHSQYTKAKHDLNVNYANSVHILEQIYCDDYVSQPDKKQKKLTKYMRA